MSKVTLIEVIYVIERSCLYVALIVLGYFFGSRANWASFTGTGLALTALGLGIWRQRLEAQARAEIVEALHEAGETFAVDDEGNVFISERLQADLVRARGEKL